MGPCSASDKRQFRGAVKDKRTPVITEFVPLQSKGFV